jgi:hypothetical protein
MITTTEPGERRPGPSNANLLPHTEKHIVLVKFTSIPVKKGHQIRALTKAE